MSEERIFGPPGTGKTTELSDQIAKAAKADGGHSILVTSFTKAAAVELTRKELPIPESHIATLHGHCYRAFGGPTIAETRLAEWNKRNPDLELSHPSDKIEEGYTEPQFKTETDRVFSQLGLLRGQMIPRKLWPGNVVRLSDRWERWKGEAALMDFTDLIELGTRDLKIAPGDPKLIVCDETQDLNCQQMTLLRNWGYYADRLVLAGDEDQTLYGWAGASPKLMLEPPVPEEHRRVLSQSRRVPRAVHAISQKWIKQVSVREPKEYKPRDADGEVILFPHGNWQYIEPIVDHAEQSLAAGKTIMLLTTCSYMLEPLKRVLAQRGLPYHNPYRRKRADWNPLEPSRGTSAVERLLALLRPREDVWGAEAGTWTAGALKGWLQWTRVNGMLKRGAKALLEAMPDDASVSTTMLTEVFEMEALNELRASLASEDSSGLIRWWLSSLTPSQKSKAEYVARVALRSGTPKLQECPQLIIGTGHSVKGGQADVVYIFPDLSLAAMREWHGTREQRDSVVRLGYVMMTRAKERLIFCEPASCRHMPLHRFKTA